MTQKRKKEIILVFVGLVAGFINGFFGAGGGLLIVPLLNITLKDETKIVHATTLACVLFMSISAGITYFCKGACDFDLILPCAIGGVMGGVLGTFLLKKIKNVCIDLIFSLVLILAGISMIVF